MLSSAELKLRYFSTSLPGSYWDVSKRNAKIERMTASSTQEDEEALESLTWDPQEDEEALESLTWDPQEDEEAPESLTWDPQEAAAGLQESLIAPVTEEEQNRIVRMLREHGYLGNARTLLYISSCSHVQGC